MENTLHISVLITTFNASKTIEQLIEGLSFAKEIIIIDSFSKDDTIKIVSKYDNVVVFQNEFIDFLSQQEFAISQSTNDWVVVFDQDEKLSKMLTKEISEIIYTSDNNLYRITRDTLFMKKSMKSTRKNKNNEVIIFNKKRYQNITQIINNPQNIKHTKTLNNHLTSYTTFDNYTQKLHNKSTLEAKILYHKNKKPSSYHFLMLPFIHFWKQFLFHLRFLDGKEGFILSYIIAFSIFKRYINLWLMYRRIE